MKMWQFLLLVSSISFSPAFSFGIRWSFCSILLHSSNFYIKMALKRLESIRLIFWQKHLKRLQKFEKKANRTNFYIIFLIFSFDQHENGKCQNFYDHVCNSVFDGEKDESSMEKVKEHMYRTIHSYVNETQTEILNFRYFEDNLVSFATELAYAFRPKNTITLKRSWLSCVADFQNQSKSSIGW